MQLDSIVAGLKFENVTKLAIPYNFANHTEVTNLQPLTYTISDKVQKIVTVTPDGIETTNTATVGDIIMCGRAGELYVIKAEKFNKFYDGGLGNTVIPNQNPRPVAQYNGKDEVSFVAGWGEQMILKPGDFLVADGSGSYYRIAAIEFKKTYNLPAHSI